MADRLMVAGWRVLNHPRHVLSRYQLLRALHERGWNKFGVYRPALGEVPRVYPAFLRIEHGHEVVSPLLYSAEEVSETLEELDDEGIEGEELLLVEFCDTADTHDVYRKYAAYIVGDTIIANSISFSRDWVTKWSDVTSDAEMEEVWRYVYSNPFEPRLREACALAGIEFGRIDYALLDGEPQIWEINTNPHVLSPSDREPTLSLERKQYVVHGLNRALRALDQPVRSLKR